MIFVLMLVSLVVAGMLLYFAMDRKTGRNLLFLSATLLMTLFLGGLGLFLLIQN